MPIKAPSQSAPSHLLFWEPTRLSRFNTLAQPRHEPEAGGSAILLPVVRIGRLAGADLGGAGGADCGPAQLRRAQHRKRSLGTNLYIPLTQGLCRASGADAAHRVGGVVVCHCGGFFACRLACIAAPPRRVPGASSRRCTPRVLKQSLRRAELEGAAAQRVRAEQLIGNQLPSIQRGLSLWYRAVPRSVLMLLGCVAVALLVNVWLALLAVVSGVLLWQLYRQLRLDDETNLAQWEVPRARRRMAEIVGQAPLLARLQAQGLADRAFGAELDSLYRRLGEEHARLGRIWPMLFFAISAAVAVLVLGLGVNLFGVDNGLSVPAALVLGLALAGAVAAAGRLIALAAQLGESGEACDAVYHYLERSSEIAPSEQRVGLARLRDAVEIQDVTLGDSTGQPILSHLSLKLTPGSLVAVLGTDSVSTRALTELLMGFGMPAEGRVTIDGIPLREVHPQALARNVMWIEPSGPMWDGTIQENLRGSDDSINSGDLVDALEEVDVYEHLNRLPEGLNTIITAGDSMLGVEMHLRAWRWRERCCTSRRSCWRWSHRHRPSTWPRIPV